MRQLAIAAAALALSTAAFAGDYEAFDVQNVASTQSREQVVAQLQQARKNGDLKVFSSFYNPAKDFSAPKALGWRTLRVRHPLGEHARADAASPLDQADRTVAGLAEVSVADLLA